MFKHVYVDLCDTLIKGNTTFMFLDSFLAITKIIAIGFTENSALHF